MSFSAIAQTNPISIDEVNIPIVFHVIRKTNANDDLIQKNIENFILDLNKNFNNVDVGIIEKPFKNIVAKCDIRFNLASTNENCNSLSSITWHYTDIDEFIVQFPPFFDDKRIKSNGYQNSKKFLTSSCLLRIFRHL